MPSGGRIFFEGYGRERNATILGWRDDARFAVLKEPPFNKKANAKVKRERTSQQVDAPDLKEGDSFVLDLEVGGDEKGLAKVTTTFSVDGKSVVLARQKLPRKQTDGYFGVAGRGLVDFSINGVAIEAGSNQPLSVGGADCCACYPLGDTLKKVDGKWQVKFVGVFASDGSVPLKGLPDIEPGTRLIVTAFDGHQSESQTVVVS